MNGTSKIFGFFRGDWAVRVSPRDLNSTPPHPGSILSRKFFLIRDLSSFRCLWFCLGLSGPSAAGPSGSKEGVSWRHLPDIANKTQAAQ